MNTKKYFSRLFQTTLMCLIILSVNGQQIPSGFSFTLLADQLNPVAFTVDPYNRIWVAEKDGRIIILDGHDHTHLFTTLKVDDLNERGLSGLALHPDFENHPWVYVYYTVQFENHNRVSRILANSDQAVPGSEEILLELDNLPGDVHHGGAMTFDSDGYLYIATGDGSNPVNSQSLDNVLGKILRLNDDGGIPKDNPFFEIATGKNKAIWSIGLRNPFSIYYSKDFNQLIATDVGAGDYEEINHILPGKNYGWPIIEGPISTQNPPEEYMDPWYAYNHDQGCAIVGLYMIGQNNTWPENFHQKVIFGDYCSSEIHLINADLSGEPLIFLEDIDRPLAFTLDRTGESLYILTRAGIGGGSVEDNTATNSGAVWQLSYRGDDSPFFVQPVAAKKLVVGESLSMTASVLGKMPIHYSWFINDEIVASDTIPGLVLDNLTAADSGSLVYCIASNELGSDTSNYVDLFITHNQRPNIFITKPVSGMMINAGDTVLVEGYAEDPEDGIIPVELLTWQVNRHHREHTHPIVSGLDSTSRFRFHISQFNETDTVVWHRIHLQATDLSGLPQSHFVDIYPQWTNVEVEGPAGIPVNIDGKLVELPTSVKSWAGVYRTWSAVNNFVLGDSLYIFRDWNENITSSVISFITPQNDTVIQINYDPYPVGNGTGLLAKYYNDPESDFDEEPSLTRIDSTIQFKWGGESPGSEISDDFFTARWSGEIQTITGGPTIFSVLSDDGSRLWVNDSLIINEWHPQGVIEHFGEITLEKGEKYSITLEYMELGGGAEVSLFWQPPGLGKQIIPKRQLYPANDLPGGRIKGTVFIDENFNQAIDQDDHPLEELLIVLYSASDTSLTDLDITTLSGQFTFTDIVPGTYILRGVSIEQPLYPVLGLNDQQYSTLIHVIPGQTVYHEILYAPFPSTIEGTVWLDENQNKMFDFHDRTLKDVSVILFDAETDEVFKSVKSDDQGEFSFIPLTQGNYFMQLLTLEDTISYYPDLGMNEQGKTSMIQLNMNEHLHFSFSYIYDQPTSTDQPGSSNFRVFPNPVSNRLYIHGLEPTKHSRCTIEIYDMFGHCWFEEPVFNESIELDFTQIPSGIYMCTIKCHNRNKSFLISKL